MDKVICEMNLLDLMSKPQISFIKYRNGPIDPSCYPVSVLYFVKSVSIKILTQNLPVVFLVLWQYLHSRVICHALFVPQLEELYL